MTFARRLILWLLVILGAPIGALANQNAQGWCETGARPVVTSGLSSATKVQQSFPSCTITVFVHGGGIATIFSDSSNTPLANPFTAQSNGRWQFFAANGIYDVQMSGAGFPVPVTLTSIQLSDPANQSAAIPCTTLAFSSAPIYAATNNACYQLTLTGNITTPSISGTPANGNLLAFTFTQDAVGGRAVAFPAGFILPPGFSIDTTALHPNYLTFKFDGVNWSFITNSGTGGGSATLPGSPPFSVQASNSAGTAFVGTSQLFKPANNPCSYLSIACDDYILPSGPVCFSTTQAADASITFGNGVSLCDTAANAISAGISGGTIGATATSRLPSARANPLSTLAVSLGAGTNATGYQSVVSDDPLDVSAGPLNLWGLTTSVSLTRASGSISNVEGIRVTSPFSQFTGSAPAAEQVGTNYGIHIQDQLAKGNTENAALKIDPQTGASSFAIKVDGGKSEFDGGVLTTGIGLGGSAIVANTVNFATGGKLALAGTNVAQINTASLELLGGKNLLLDGATSGAVTLAVPANAGSNTATFPANTGTLAETNFGQTWTAAQTFNPNFLLLAGATSGNVTVNAAAVAGSSVATLPANTGTVAEINLAQTWSANQSIANGSAVRFLSPDGTHFAAITGPGSNPASSFTLALPSADATGTQCISSNGAGVLSFTNCSGGTGTPGGSTTQVQFNSAGSFGGSPNLTWVSPALTIGLNATATGQLALANGGGGGASVTVQNNSATSAYNFNLPIAAGTSGQPLISGGGAAAPMTFGTLGFSGGGTNQTTFTANQLVTDTAGSLASVTGTLTGTNPVLTLTSALATSVPFALNTPVSPTADIFDLSINSVKTAWFDNSAILHTPATTYSGSGPISISGNLGTCPAPAAGTDIVCVGDLGSGVVMIANNGASAKPVMLFTNTAPTAHGVVIANPTFPQSSTTAAGTAGQVLLSNGPAADPAFGTSAVPGGGTGAATFTTHGVIMGEGTSPLAASAAGTAGQAFLSGGAGADGAYAAFNLAGGASLVTGVLPVGNGGTGASSLAGASIATVTGIITPGDCASFSAGTVITDAGAPCGGGGGSVSLSAITAGTVSHTINSTVFPQTWNWALTGSTVGMKFGENTAATGSSNIVLQATTLSTSTAAPFQADSNGNGMQVTSAGLVQKVGAGAFAVGSTLHGTLVSQGATTAVTAISPGTAGQLLVSNGGSNDPSYQDPIVSYGYVPLLPSTAATGTAAGSAQRVSTFGGFGSLIVTYASITGSPSACTLAIKTGDSNGNLIANGSAVSTSPANGTTSVAFAGASGQQTFEQMSVAFNCSVYPSTGTIVVDYAPGLSVGIMAALPTGANTIGAVTQASGPWTSNLTQVGSTAVDTNSGTKSAGTLRVVLATDQPQLTNKLLVTPDANVKVNAVGNAGVSLDAVIGAAAPANVFAEGLKDTAGNSQAALSDTNGRQFIKTYPDTTTTSFHASKKFAASSTTDVAVMPGNATNTAILTRIIVTCTQTTAGVLNIEVLKRSTADTSGTSAGMTAIPDDANYSAAVSAPLSYTGTGPTVGTPIGDIDNAQIGCLAAATAGANDVYVFRPAKPIVLRGTAQQVALNLGGAVTGGNVTVTWEWMESTTP